MEYKLTHTENYLLIVDDSEISIGHFYLTSDNTILQCEKILLGLIYSSGDYGRNVNGVKRIISHLPLNNSSLLSGVNLLPDLKQEDDVEKLAQSFKNKWGYSTDEYFDGVEDGYNKAKEKYKYTEEDIRKVIEQTLDKCNELLKDSYGELEVDEDEIIQSLSQPKLPVAFKCEIYDTIFGDINTGKLLKWKPKTTTDSQGQIVWVGEYVYDNTSK